MFRQTQIPVSSSHPPHTLFNHTLLSQCNSLPSPSFLYALQLSPPQRPLLLYLTSRPMHLPLRSTASVSGYLTRSVWIPWARIATGLQWTSILPSKHKVGVFAHSSLFLRLTLTSKVCDRGLQPSADDFAVFEKQFIIPTYSKLGKLGVKLPRTFDRSMPLSDTDLTTLSAAYKPQIKKLVESIVNQCAKKQKTNFCKQADLDKVKGCAVDKAMGFIVSSPFPHLQCR